ncbi:MAG: DUF4249 family protein [Flavobacteriales bacterium]|nr:DUF4249 family protein [Flavobacteriales bacterium]
MLYAVAVCCMLLLSSCIPDPLEIAVEEHQPRPVVASQIIPDKELVVALTRSFSPLSDPIVDGQVSQAFLDKILISDAWVTISYLGRTDTLHMVSPGIYASDLSLVYDYGTYELHAKDPVSGQEISATSTMLPRVNFDTVFPGVVRTPDDTIITVHYSIEDDPTVPNWYLVGFYKRSDPSVGTNLDITDYFGDGANQLSEVELISDQLFEDGKYTASKVLEGVSGQDTIAVVLSNISEGYFEFLHAFKKSGNILNQLTGEPINYPTNVTNGYGYFNTHNPDAHVFDLKAY